MKKWILFLFFILSSTSLIANQTPPAKNLTPPTESSDTEAPLDIVTPKWAVDPIDPSSAKNEPYSEMMKNKHIAAVIIGTATTIILGLIISGSGTGKHPTSSHP